MLAMAVVLAAGKSTTAPAILIGTAILFVGAASALFASSKEFKAVGWNEPMEYYGRITAYLGALVAFIAVLAELGSNLLLLGFITAGIAITFLVALLVASIVVRRKARFSKQGGVQQGPKANADRQRPTARGVGTDSQEAEAPKEGAVDRNVPEPEHEARPARPTASER